MNAPRLIATDLDGTLVRSDQTISARSRDVIQRALSAGCLWVAVTGRPPRWMSMIADQVGHAGEVIVANGAGVLDLATMQLLRTRPIDPDVSAEVVRLLRTVVPGAMVAGETGSVFLREAGYRSAYGDNPDTLVLPADEVIAVPLLKLLVRSTAHDADALLELGMAAVGSLVECTHSSNDGLLEISAAGVSKATTLAMECERLGVDAADVVAFGDMPNDVPMLRWAGRSFAVANAHQSARAAAQHLTLSNDHDGVADVLERWF